MKIYIFSVGSFGTNCYFLVDEKSGKTAIIDPGDNAEKLEEKIKSKNLIPVAILLTHGHFDHIMAVEELRKNYNIPLYIHAEDVEMIEDSEKSCMRMFAGKDEPLSPPDKIISDGDTIKIGELDIKVMHTPGHTKGSVCYIVDDCVFCGDTIFRNSIGRYDLYGGDFKQILFSVIKLKKLPDSYKLYPGHGSATTIEREKRENYFFQ